MNERDRRDQVRAGVFSGIDVFRAEKRSFELAVVLVNMLYFVERTETFAHRYTWHS